MEKSDSVFKVKKSINFAKFFLRVGKRSDAQRKLREAMDVITTASRTKMSMDDETRALALLLEEVSALWKETNETKDPPGSSFLLGMGDVIYLSIPGGGGTFIDLEKDYKTSTTSATISQSPSPVHAPVSTSTPIAITSRPVSSPVAPVSVAPSAPSSIASGILNGARNVFRRATTQAPPVSPPVVPVPAVPASVPPVSPPVVPAPAVPASVPPVSLPVVPAPSTPVSPPVVPVSAVPVSAVPTSANPVSPPVVPVSVSSSSALDFPSRKNKVIRDVETMKTQYRDILQREPIVRNNLDNAKRNNDSDQIQILELELESVKATKSRYKSLLDGSQNAQRPTFKKNHELTPFVNNTIADVSNFLDDYLLGNTTFTAIISFFIDLFKMTRSVSDQYERIDILFAIESILPLIREECVALSENVLKRHFSNPISDRMLKDLHNISDSYGEIHAQLKALGGGYDQELGNSLFDDLVHESPIDGDISRNGQNIIVLFPGLSYPVNPDGPVVSISKAAIINDETIQQPQSIIPTASRIDELQIPQDRKDDRQNSVVLVDGKIPVLSKNSVDGENPNQIAYALAHIGTDESQRMNVFFGVLDQFKRVGKDSRKGSPTDALPYYSQYFTNACRRSKAATVSDDHPQEFVKHVLGQINSDNNEVHPFHVMLLQTIPVKIPAVNDSTYQNKSRRVISFSFLEFINGRSSMYVKLLCSTEGNTISGGTKMMNEIEKVGKAYGVPRITLGAVLPAVGFYYRMGYNTTSQEFDNIMNMIFNMERRTRTSVKQDPSGFNVLAISILTEYQNTLEAKINELNDDDRDANLAFIEFMDNDTYKNSVASAILQGLILGESLVRTIIGFFPDIGNDKAVFEEKLREIHSRVSEHLNRGVYGMDEDGNADIQMFKDI